MADPQIDTTAFATARTRLDGTEAALRATEAKLARARAEHARLQATGATAAAVTAADGRVKALLAERAAGAKTRDGLRGQLHDLSKRAIGTADPARFVATLDGAVPVCLLPVRLETRFFSGGSELRIRIYPDQLHLDAHEPELTDYEVAAGKRYWLARWGGGEDARHAAWSELTATMDPRRAAWVSERMTPANAETEAAPVFPTPPLKGDDWARAVQATALPGRWVAIGYRGGRELFRRWGAAVPDTLAATPEPDPAVDPAEPAPIAPGELPGDAPMRWMLDYDAALAVGMAITVKDADLPTGQSLKTGLDRLVVLGVDWTQTADAGAARLQRLLDAHRVSDGLSFVAQGTPTNNTGGERSGADSTRSAVAAELEPAVPARALPADAAAPRLARALGLADGALSRVPDARLLEARTASLLHQVLWMSTLEHYLDELLDPLLSDRTVALARDHVTRWLHPAGPFGTLRIGKQPYGVLPVVAPGRFAPAGTDGIEAKLSSVLGRVRWLWADAAGRLPRMGRTGDPDTDLHELLQRNPLAMVARFRKVLGPASVANTEGLERHSSAQAWSWSLWGRVHGWPRPPWLAAHVADPKDHPLPVPFVQAAAPGDAPLEPNYLQGIAALARARDGRETLNDQVDADTLLQALVAHAALEELTRAAANVVLTRAQRDPVTQAGAKSLRTDELYGIVPARRPSGGPVDAPGVTVSTTRQLANLVIPQLTGTLTLAEHVSVLVNTVGRPAPEVETLDEFLKALDGLATRPAAEIDRAFRGFLDATSHRFDAWATSLAARRLGTVRSERPAGVHLGGYGWVDRLHLDTAPDSLGYVHAPSIPHAATAAILRSGHLSHRDAEHETLDIKLSSDRVQRALPVIEGAAAGQPMSALLGYRFERSLRESSDKLARYILPARRFAPLRPSTEPPASGPQEAIAASDVVDGVRLLEAWRDNRANVIARIGATPDAPRVSAVLDDLAITWDAVGDVLVSESVYQTVLGNMERAGAAFAAIDKQERPPDPEVIRTPRTGVTYTQKVLMAFADETAREPWKALRDVRSAAAPAVSAWIATLLPDPARVVLWGVVTKAGTPAPVSVTPVELGLSPLALVVAATTGATAGPSELESRIAQALIDRAGAAPTDTVELDDGRPAGAAAAIEGELGLGALRALLGWLRELLTGCRALTAEEFALPGGNRATGIDLPHLAARADAAATAFATADTAFTAAAGQANASATVLRRALAGVAVLGIAEAVPRAAAGSTPEVRELLRAQVEASSGELTRRRAQLAALGAGPAPGPDGVPPAEATVVAHHTRRLKTVFGDAFPVLPRFKLTAPAEIAPSVADRAALTNGDDVAPRSWLDRMALVRPGTDKLARALMAAEVLGAPGAGAAAVAVAQLPHAPKQRWLALPFPDSGPAAAVMALAVHAPGGLAPTKALVGVVCDEWVETVPGGAELTGVTFHYDAPGARAPQSLLLAVPPAMDMARWDLDSLLDTVLEAAALVRLRGVGLREMRLSGAQLPTVYLPQNFTRDRPSLDLGRLLARHATRIEHAEVLGKGWSL